MTEEIDTRPIVWTSSGFERRDIVAPVEEVTKESQG